MNINLLYGYSFLSLAFSSCSITELSTLFDFDASDGSDTSGMPPVAPLQFHLITRCK